MSIVCTVAMFTNFSLAVLLAEVCSSGPGMGGVLLVLTV